MTEQLHKKEEKHEHNHVNHEHTNGEHKHGEKHEHQHPHVEHKHDEKKEQAEHKHEEKKENKKQEKILKKDEAVAIGRNLHISKKHAMNIGKFIKGKKIDEAIRLLEDVSKMKRVVPFKGEIPHRRGNVMSGRYPVNASKALINVLKSLKGNALVNGIDLDKARITIMSATWGSRPMRRGGMQGKRAYVVIKTREIVGGKK